MLANAIGAEFREVAERDHEGRPARVVVATRTYPTTPEDLWDAVTSRERIPRWFMGIEGDLRLGGRYQLVGNAGGTITRCDPPSALDLTWEFGGGMSWVTLRLAAAEGEGAGGGKGGTLLTLEHIVAASDVDEHWAKFGPAAVGVGWDLGLLGLGLHIETGLDRTGFFGPGQGPDAWAASDAGKAFMRASADAWAAAHIAAGEDADVARGMATRTAAFYTGG